MSPYVSRLLASTSEQLECIPRTMGNIACFISYDIEIFESTLKTKTYTAREKPLVFDYPSLHSLPHLPSKDWRPRRRHPEDTVPQQTESQYFGDES